MANKKINELDVRASLSLSDLMLVGDPATGYAYKTTLTDIKTLIATEADTLQTVTDRGATTTNSITAAGFRIANLAVFSNDCVYTYISNHCGSSGRIGFGFTNTVTPSSSDALFDIYQAPAIAPGDLFTFRHTLANSTGNNTNYNIINIATAINQTGGSNGIVRGVYYNPTLTNVVGTHYAYESTSGKIKISDLSGTGSRMVVADANGVLSTSALPTSTNIYTADGTLTGNRTVSMSTFTLTFAGKININTSGQSRQISTFYGANSNGLNIYIGGGGNNSVGSVGDNTLGSYNTALGVEALNANTTGQYNTGIGVYSLRNNTTGYSNSSLGTSTLQNNLGGYNNAALGVTSMQYNTSGYNNAALGEASLLYNTTGYNNVSIGGKSARLRNDGTVTLETNNNSIFIGYDSRGLANGNTNEIVIASNGRGLGSNTTVIGNSSTTDTAIYGRMLVNYGTPVIGTYALDVNGTGRFTDAITFGGSNNIQLLSPSNNNNVVIGAFSSGAITTGTNNILISTGVNSFSATALKSIYIGWANNTQGSDTITLGNSNTTTSGMTFGIGNTCNTGTLAIGNSMSATGSQSIAVGKGGTASGQNSFLVATNGGSVTGSNSISIGNTVNVTGNVSVGMGVLTTISQSNTFAVGSQSPWNISNVFFGSGVQRDGSTTGAGENYTINGSGALGTDFAGGNITIAGGKGTGSGTPGDIIFATATVTTTGTTLQTLTNRWWIKAGTGVLTNVTGPATAAIFQADSTTQGILPPRMTTTQKNAISAPVPGLVVYDTTLNKLCVYTTAWQTITSA